MQILASSLLQELEDEEKSILLHQLIQLKNVNFYLIDTIISSIPGNDDSIVLVLGALVKNSNVTIQKIVVNELLKRLNETITSTNNTGTLMTLTYALGNSGSKLAIHALLYNLQHDDIDIQMAAIRSLGYHLDQPIVQEAITISLALTEEDKILEEILAILIEAYDSVMINPSKKLLDTVLNCTIKLQSPNLYEMFENYLQKIHNDDVEDYLNLLKQQQNYGDVARDLINEMNGVDPRVKRGTDWDENNRDYDVVASYSQRRHDVNTYKYHKAYIWGDRYGVDKLNLKVGAGGFIGASCRSQRLKAFVKAAGKLEVFGRTFNLLHFEYSDHTYGNTLYHKEYVKVGPFVMKNNYKTYTDGKCKDYNVRLWNTGDFTLFDLRFGVFIYVASLGVHIRGSISSHGDLNICTCPSKASVCGNVVPSLSVRVSGAAGASLLVSFNIYV